MRKFVILFLIIIGFITPAKVSAQVPPTPGTWNFILKYSNKQDVIQKVFSLLGQIDMKGLHMDGNETFCTMVITVYKGEKNDLLIERLKNTEGTSVQLLSMTTDSGDQHIVNKASNLKPGDSTRITH